MSVSTIHDKQRAAFKELIQNGIPNTIKNHSIDFDDYSLKLEVYPIAVNKMLTENGTDYVPIRAMCTLENHVTSERVQFNVDLLKLPVFQELGFKIKGNYMQMLDLYERTPGWCFTTKTNSDGTNITKATLLSMNGRNFSFLFDNKRIPLVSFKPASTKSDKGVISVSTFFRALTGMTSEELLDKFGYDNPFAITAFSDNKRAHPEATKYRLRNRNDCIEALADACLGTAQAAKLGNLALKNRDVCNYLFSPNYMNLGESYAMRLEYEQSYSYRAAGKTLAEDITLYDRVLKEGTILSNDELMLLDMAPINHLKVSHDGKIFNLHKWSHFTFPVLGYVLKEDLPTLNMKTGDVLDFDKLKAINDSDLCELKVASSETSGSIVLTRRKYANSLDIEDLYTAFNIWIDNLNGFDTFDHQYELTNRIVVPFDKEVLNIIDEHLGCIIRMLTEKLHVMSVTDTMVGAIPDFSREINLDKFIAKISDAGNRAGQQSDMCNIMAFVSKNNKATSTIKADNVTPDMVNVQDLQEGRLDPFDAPESSKIGIVHHRTILAQRNADGYITSPYLVVKNCQVVSEEPVYLTAAEEADKYIAQWNETFVDKEGNKKQYVKVRCNGNILNVTPDKVGYMEFSPYQGMSPAHSTIPFPGHSNGKRITMGINQQKQALPLPEGERPYVNGGGESIIEMGYYKATDVLSQYYNSIISVYPSLSSEKEAIMKSDLVLREISAENNLRYLTFEVKDAKEILERNNCSYDTTVVFSYPYLLKNFENGVFSYNINHVPDGVYHADDIVAYNNGYSLKNPEHLDFFETGAHKIPPETFNKGMALVKNLVVFYKTYGGSTIDDAITIGSHLNTDDSLTSISMYTVKDELKKSERFGIKEGSSREYFQINGLPAVGTYLRPEDPVISKISYRGDSQNVHYKYLGPYVQGHVISAETVIEDGVETAIVQIACRSTIEVGDKLAGRCGNKGVIARIVPYEQMPYDPETGLVADIILNPLGIPSRQNITQLLEVALSMCLKMDNKISYVSPYHEGDLDFVREQANGHNVHPAMMVDGRTGQYYERPINYGVISMYKLHHMVHKKIHAIGMDAAVDPVFLQPRKGSKLGGGQSFGEMESWCLEGIGAKHVLNDLYSFHSDDVETKTDIQMQMERGHLSAADDIASHGANHNDLSMQACFRTLGVEFVSNESENCYEFAPLSDKVIKSFSPKPVTDEKSLHSTAIFGKNASVADKAKSRDKWGWLDLHCKIINPLWIEKGGLNKLVLIYKESFSDTHASSEDFKRIISGKVYLEATERSKTLLYLYNASDEEISGIPNISEVECDSKDLLTGMDALVWIFENFDISATEKFYKAAVEKYKNRKKSKGEDLAQSDSYKDALKLYRLVDDFISRGAKLSDYVTTSFPVMPQTYRPIIEMNVRSVPDFDWHYTQILKAIRAVQLEHNQKTLQTLYDRIRLFQGLGASDSKYNKKYQNVLNYFMGKDKNDNHGKIRSAVQSKRIVCSGRSSIVPAEDTTMNPTQIGVPITMLVRMYESQLIGLFKNNSSGNTNVSNSYWKKLLMAVALDNYVSFDLLYNKKFTQLFTKPAHVMMHVMKQWIVDFINEGDHVVLAGRQPSLHKYSIRAFNPVVVFTKAINIHPLVCKGYNADFDGDQMWVAALFSREAKEEAMTKMCADKDFINPKNSSIMLEHSQDIALGIYCATMLKDNVEFYPYKISDIHYYDSVEQLSADVDAKLINTYDLVCLNHEKQRKYLSTAGRILFNNCLYNGFTDRPFSNPLKVAGIKDNRFFDLAYDGVISSGKGSKCKLVYHNLQSICKDLYMENGNSCIDEYQALSMFGFKFSDKFGVSLSLEDLDINSNKEQILQEAAAKKILIERDFRNGLISAADKKNAIEELYSDKENGANTLVKKALIGSIPRNNNIFIMMDSGARGNESQIMHMCGAIGTLQKTKTENMEDPVTSNYYEGLDSFDVHMASYSSRIGVASTQNETRKAGYATHQVVFMSGGVKIVEEDCGRTDWTFDVEWGDRIYDLDKFIPSKSWFDSHLLGHTIANDDIEAIEAFGVSDNRVITEESFTTLNINGGFHSVRLEDTNKSIVIDIDTLNTLRLSDNDSFNQKFLAKLLTNGRLNRKCISALERKHVKSVHTEHGVFTFRYKIDDGCRSLLLYREAKNLPFLATSQSLTTGKSIDVISEETLEFIEQAGLEHIEARVTFDCKSKNGICAHCYGLKYSNLMLPNVGDFVGTEAAQAIGEPAAQLTMSLINKGGAAGESVASGVEIFESLLSGGVPGEKNLDSAMVAQNSGYVEIEKLDTTVAISVVPENKECSMCKECMAKFKTILCPKLTSNDLSSDPLCLIPIRAKASLVIPQNNEWVDSGDQLTRDAMTEFIVSPNKITSVADNKSPEVVMRKRQMVWTLDYYNTFKANNIIINARQFEVLARIQNQYVLITESNCSDIEEGKVYEFSEIRDHLDDVKFSMYVSKRADVILRNSGAMTALAFENNASVAAKLTVTGFKSYADKNNALIGGISIGSNLLSDKVKSISTPSFRYVDYKEDSDAVDSNAIEIIQDTNDNSSVDLDSIGGLSLDSIMSFDIDIADGNADESKIDKSIEKSIGASNVSKVNAFSNELEEEEYDEFADEAIETESADELESSNEYNTLDDILAAENAYLEEQEFIDDEDEEQMVEPFIADTEIYNKEMGIMDTTKKLSSF